MNKILVGISSQKLCEDVADMLRSGGFLVQSAEESAGLLRCLSGSGADLCLIDQNFRGMNLKSLSLFVEEKYETEVLIAAHQADVYLLSFLGHLRLGFYYEKPYQKERLLHLLQSALSIKEAIRDKEAQMKVQRRESLLLEAKKKLMEAYLISEHEAYEMLRKKSMDRRMKIEEVAAEILGEERG